MERTPGIKFIYSSTKDFFESFAGHKKKFSKSVLANIFPQTYGSSVLTDDEMEKFELGADKVAVYVPQAYNFAGQLYILPRERITQDQKALLSGEAMKYAVTGGVVGALDAEGRWSGGAGTKRKNGLIVKWLNCYIIYQRSQFLYESIKPSNNLTIAMKIIFFFIFFILLQKQALLGLLCSPEKINYFAVFLLPPEMMVLYKPNIGFGGTRCWSW